MVKQGAPLAILACAAVTCVAGRAQALRVVDSHGTPIAGAVVYSHKPGERIVRRDSTTLKNADKDGWVRLSPEPPPIGPLVVAAVGYAPEALEMDPAREARVVLHEGLSHRGRCLDSAGRPVEHALVTISKIPYQARGETRGILWLPGGDRRYAVYSGVSDATGDFTVRDVPRGEYVLQAWHDSMVAVRGLTHADLLNLTTPDRQPGSVIEFSPVDCLAAESRSGALVAIDAPQRPLLGLDGLAIPGIRHVKSVISDRTGVDANWISVGLAPRPPYLADIRILSLWNKNPIIASASLRRLASPNDIQALQLDGEATNAYANSELGQLTVELAGLGVQQFDRLHGVELKWVGNGSQESMSVPCPIGRAIRLPVGNYTLKGVGSPLIASELPDAAFSVRSKETTRVELDERRELAVLRLEIVAPFLGPLPPGVGVQITGPNSRRLSLINWGGQGERDFLVSQGRTGVTVGCLGLSGAVDTSIGRGLQTVKVVLKGLEQEGGRR